jgi:hypothetical protein
MHFAICSSRLMIADPFDELTMAYAIVFCIRLSVQCADSGMVGHAHIPIITVWRIEVLVAPSELDADTCECDTFLFPRSAWLPAKSKRVPGRCS